MKIVFLIAACASVLAVFLICVFLFANGLPAMGKIGPLKFLFGTEWRPTNDKFGILPMIVASIYVTAGAILIGVPIALFTSVFMARYCPKKIYKPLKSGIELMAGVPSIVYGYFGLVLLVPLIRQLFGGTGSSMLAACILLGIMILPTIIGVTESAVRSVPESYYEGSLALGATKERSIFFVMLPAAKSGILAGIVLGIRILPRIIGVTESAVRSVPESYYEGSLALGATKERSIFFVMLPAAKSGILAGVVLGIGRAIGETMAVIMVAGNQPRMPKGLLQGVRTMTANIVTEMGYASGLHREALIATGVVLFVFILIINLSLSLLNRRAEHAN